MNKWVSIAVIIMMATSGCMVSKTKYDSTLSDLEAAQAELEKSRMHQEALDEQIRNLKGLNEKISTDLEVMTTEVQRIKEGRENEHTLLETRERELDEERAKLSTKLRVITDQYQKVKAQNKALKNTVLRYKKELKESRELGMEKFGDGGLGSRTESSQSSSSSAGSLKVAKPSKPKAPKIATPPSLPKIGSDRININTASVSDLVLTLGLSRDIAEEVVSNRPYRLRGELVAKNVIPKATFDEIKGRITAAP